MNIFINLIYGSEPFELAFDVPIEEAIERLASKVSRTSISRLTSQGMVGSVREESTKIQRVIPFVQNSFKPIFIGSFSTNGSQTVLAGVLRLHRVIQAFMTIWFSFIALWIVMSSFALLTKRYENWTFPLHGVLMFA